LFQQNKCVFFFFFLPNPELLFIYPDEAVLYLALVVLLAVGPFWKLGLLLYPPFCCCSLLFWFISGYDKLIKTVSVCWQTTIFTLSNGNNRFGRSLVYKRIRVKTDFNRTLTGLEPLSTRPKPGSNPPQPRFNPGSTLNMVYPFFGF